MRGKKKKDIVEFKIFVSVPIKYSYLVNAFPRPISMLCIFVFHLFFPFREYITNPVLF